MVNRYQIIDSILNAEIKRAIKKGLIGKLSSSDFNDWCIGWWLENGLDENGKECKDGHLRDPYSGRIISMQNKKSQLILEHIIPIDRNGGTIIFNVLPSRSDVNSSKSNNDPIEWWLNSGFFNEKRFKVLIKYIFDAYDKRIKEGLFSLDNDEITNDESIYDDCIELLDDGEEYEEQSIKNDRQKLLNKISYAQFLSSCITLLETFDKELANSYRQKLEMYEKIGIFTNIGVYQQIQSIIFSQIRQLDSAQKYIFLRRINMNKMINSLANHKDLESEIQNRFNKIIELIKIENSTISFKDLLFMYPNIICISSEELKQKIEIIKNLNLGNDLMLVVKNNAFLLSLSIDEIPNKIKEIRQTLGEEYIHIFINTSLQYEDIKIINYIKNCHESRQLKNLRKQESDDTLDAWLMKNTTSKIYGTFINTLSFKITGKSFKYTSFNGLIKQKYISLIVGSLYECIENDKLILNNPNKLKELLNKIISNISSENIEKMKLIGESINDKKKNLLDLFYKCVDDNLIQNYICLELIKNKKLLELENEELNSDIDIVKRYILNADSLRDLSLEKLNLVTKNLPNIGLLNGNFATRLHQRLIYIKNLNYDRNRQRQLYISKKDVALVTERLMKEIDFSKDNKLDIIRNIIFSIIHDEVSRNNEFFAPLNYLTDNKKTDFIADLFYKELENETLQKFLMIEQLLRQKKEELTNKEKLTTEKRNQQKKEEIKQKKKEELIKIMNYINNCEDISHLRFENINKIQPGSLISLNEWINMNIDIKVLNLNNLNRSFEKSLIDRIRSGSTKYSKKNIERELITIIVEQLNIGLDFEKKPSIDEQKEIVNRVISAIIINENMLKKLDGYKGTTFEEKISNFKNLIYKFIEDGSIETYLLLDQKVKQKEKQLYIDSQNQKFKRSA